MPRSSRRAHRCVVVAMLLAGCSSPDAAVTQGSLSRGDGRVESLEVAPSLAHDGALAANETRVNEGPEAPRAAATVLDQRNDGAVLYGTLEPAPSDGDPERVLVLRTALDGRPIDPSLDGARVLDARFAGETIVIVGVDHVLRAHLRGAVRELDAGVEAPLSVEGETVAYARGEMPLFELARVDLATGAVRGWTEGMAPVWSPALSPDGAEAIFVSGASGEPRLHRVSADGTITALRPIDHFPSGLRAPRWSADDRLSFEDERSATWTLDVVSGRFVQ